MGDIYFETRKKKLMDNKLEVFAYIIAVGTAVSLLKSLVWIFAFSDWNMGIQLAIFFDSVGTLVLIGGVVYIFVSVLGVSFSSVESDKD